MLPLKTLFNIVEARFMKLLNFDARVEKWCSDGSIISQEYSNFDIYDVTFKISMIEYHYLINRTVVLMIYSHLTVYGEKKVCQSDYLCIFTS